MSSLSKLRIDFLVNDEDQNPGSPITPSPPLEDECGTRTEQGNAKRRRTGGLPIEYLLNPVPKTGECLSGHESGNRLLTETVTPAGEYTPFFTSLYREVRPTPAFNPPASLTELPPLRQVPLQLQTPQSPLPPFPQLIPRRRPSITLVHELAQPANARGLATEGRAQAESAGDDPRSQSRCDAKTCSDDEEEEHAEGYARALDGQRQGRGREELRERHTFTGKRGAPEGVEAAAAPPVVEKLRRSPGNGDRVTEAEAQSSSGDSGNVRNDGGGLVSTSVETRVTTGSAAVAGEDSGRRSAQGRRKGRSNGDARSRPFACSSCEKRFHQQSGLDSHVRVVHLKERRFECPRGCGLRFGARGDVTRHVDAVHLKKRDWVCYICGDAFSRKSILTRHCWNVHKVEYRENLDDGGEGGRG